MSRAALLSASSTSPLDGCVCSSSSSQPFSSGVCFRNDNNAAILSVSFKRMDIPSGFVISRRNKFIRSAELRHFDEKRRSRWGAVVASASLSADGTAVVADGEEKEAEKAEERKLVGKLLSLVEGSDRGVQFGKEEHAKVGAIVGQLEQYCIPEPLQSPLIYGGWDVVYSSNPTSPGGGYRSWIGRLIFRTRDMVQVNEPDAALNFVRFSLFGFIPGEVSLRGKVERLDQEFIRIDYEPPVFQLGPITFQYGKISSVTLAIIYLDDKLRIARGIRGTVLVFTRR